MVIGIDASRAFAAFPTGIGVYSTEVISGLAADPPADLRLYLNARRPPEGAPRLPEGSEYAPIPLRRGWTRLRLRWELARRPPDLLFVPAYRLPPGRLPPSVVTVHGVEHRMTGSAYSQAAARSVDDFVRDTLGRARRVITPSETTRSDLCQLYGADPAKVKVIPHGVSEALLGADPRATSVELERLRVPRPYLLVVGAHHPRKNVQQAVRALAAAFPGAGGSPSLVVANAAGEAASELARLAQELGVGRRVLLLPHLGPAALAALYRGSEATLVPSLYEGFGLPALEAMALGSPVLAGDSGAVAEVAAGAAILLPSRDLQRWAEGIRELMSNQDLRRHLSGLGRERSSRYTWERSVAEHRAVLLEELSAGRGAP
ncbi:MAG: glycosyltransferase family 4 protein [Candidatus Dormibacteria bacterium]